MDNSLNLEVTGGGGSYGGETSDLGSSLAAVRFRGLKESIADRSGKRRKANGSALKKSMEW